MADEPIDNEDAEAEGAEDAPIESQAVGSAAESAAKLDATGVVVEAKVIAPNVRKPVPRGIIAAALGVLVVVSGIAGFDAWVRAGEVDAFAHANQRDTADSWQGYLAWAEDQGFWTRARTPLERRIEYASERRDVRRAYGAAQTSDWPALCGMLTEFEGDAPAYGAAQRALRERAESLIARSLQRLNAASVPASLRNPVEAAFMEVVQNSPCGAGARVTFGVEAPTNLAERASALEAAAVAIDLSLQPIVQELSGRNELFNFELADSPGGEPVMLEYTVNAELVTGDTVRISDGSPFAIPALLVEVRVHGPSTEMASQKIRYTLPAAFGVELFAESRSKSAADLTALAVQRLVGHVPARLRQVAGLATFRADGGVAAYSRCAGMEVIDRSTTLRANTARDGSDRLEFSCEDDIEPYYEGCCENEDMNAVGRPEVGYRLMVNERSLVSLSVDGDFGPIVGIFGECGPTSRELTCGELGTTRAVLEPGVYSAYVGGMADEDAGAFELTSSIQPVASIPRACAAVTGELQSGVAVSGNTARADDSFSGECGGAGAGEDTYRLAVPERSRVRCSVDGFGGWVLHARSECEDFESEVACSSGRSLRLIAEPGTLFVSVDGHARSEGDYELLCEVVPVPAAVAGSDLCAAAESVEVTVGQESTVNVDLLNASGRSSIGPEAAYRFELTEDAYVQAASVSPIGISLLDECAREGARSANAAARLPAGTHYLMARGRRPLDFARQTINVRSTPTAPLCEAAILLRAGVTGGVVGASSEPAIFGADCTPSSNMREALFRVRALHAMHIRLRAEGFGLSIHEGCGGRSLTCAPTSVGTVEARLEPGEYTILVRGRASSSFQLETQIERL